MEQFLPLKQRQSINNTNKSLCVCATLAINARVNLVHKHPWLWWRHNHHTTNIISFFLSLSLYFALPLGFTSKSPGEPSGTQPTHTQSRQAKRDTISAKSLKAHLFICLSRVWLVFYCQKHSMTTHTHKQEEELLIVMLKNYHLARDARFFAQKANRNNFFFWWRKKFIYKKKFFLRLAHTQKSHHKAS